MITTTLASALLINAGFQSRDISDYLPTTLKDVSFENVLTKSNLKEATKINKDYNKQLAFAQGSIQAKEPFKLRISAKIEDTKGLLIMNGSRGALKIPSMRLSTSIDSSKDPGRRTNLMDMGILTIAIATKFYDAKFVRFDRETGNPVFDLTFPKELDYTVRSRVWLDKTKKCMVKREQYGMEGEFKATYFYSGITEIGGIHFPTKLTALNAENKTAAEFQLKNFAVNTNLSEDLFKL
jgi:outer membrane lipoprotein-sorting protein